MSWGYSLADRVSAYRVGAGFKPAPTTLGTASSWVGGQGGRKVSRQPLVLPPTARGELVEACPGRCESFDRLRMSGEVQSCRTLQAFWDGGLLFHPHPNPPPSRGRGSYIPRSARQGGGDFTYPGQPVEEEGILDTPVSPSRGRGFYIPRSACRGGGDFEIVSNRLYSSVSSSRARRTPRVTSQAT